MRKPTLIDKNKLINAIKKSHNRTDVVVILKLPKNGKSLKTIKEHIEKYNIDISHFDKQYKNRKWEIVIKNCPICLKEFKIKKDHPRAKTTCSKSCSNTYFRTGLNASNYKTICFSNHKKECIICKENKIVAVHHYDENHENNKPENLVPMCPNHHFYYHSRYRHLVIKKIDKYVKNFIKENINNE